MNLDVNQQMIDKKNAYIHGGITFKYKENDVVTRPENHMELKIVI